MLPARAGGHTLRPAQFLHGTLAVDILPWTLRPSSDKIRVRTVLRVHLLMLVAFARSHRNAVRRI